MKTENTETEEIQSKTDDAIKITITKDAERILSDVVKRINGEFEGGKVNRQIVASWLLEKSCEELSEADIKAIQSHSFDPSAALSALYKRFQEGENMPPELIQFLRAQSGLDAPAKKNTKSRLTKESTNGGVSEDKDTQ